MKPAICHNRLWPRAATALMLVLLLTTRVTSAQVPGADGFVLPALEAQARENAAQRQMVRSHIDLQTHRIEAAEASAGVRLQSETTLTRAHEAVTDTTTRRYERGHVKLGVRLPLLGSRAVALRDLDDAETGLVLAHLDDDAAARAITGRVRSSYIDLAAALALDSAARAFLQPRDVVNKALTDRRHAGLLLPADYLAFQTHWDTAERDAARQRLAAQNARRALSVLTGTMLDRAEASWPQWSGQCAGYGTLRVGSTSAPVVARAQVQSEAARRAAQLARYEGIEAGVSLSHSLSRDIGGRSGHNTTLSLDLNMPLQWHRWRDARRAEAQVALAQAEMVATLRAQEHRQAVERAAAEVQLRDHEIAIYERRVEAALETWRVARLRTEGIDGDTYERALQARYALYQSVVEAVEARAHYHQSMVVALALGEGCEATGVASDGIETAALPLLRVVPVDDRSPKAARLGFYVWKAKSLVDDPGRLDLLPPGTGRLLLSFDAAELDWLSGPAGADALRRLLREIRGRGWRAEWLLGEPNWVLPDHRADLLAKVRALSSFEFDALHLDLERSQLPPHLQSGWDAHLIDTLAEVSRVSPWPIALTTHYRELTEALLGMDLREAGVREVVVMIYVTRHERALEIARQAQSASPEGLVVSIAQSIEPELGPALSTHQSGRAASLAHWHKLHRALAQHARHGGVIVQSLESYFEAMP